MNSYCLHNNKSIFPAFFNCLLVSHHHFVLLSLRSGNLASEMWFSKETPQTDPGHMSLKRSECISPFSLSRYQSIYQSIYLSISDSLSLSFSATLTLSLSTALSASLFLSLFRSNLFYKLIFMLFYFRPQFSTSSNYKL